MNLNIGAIKYAVLEKRALFENGSYLNVKEYLTLSQYFENLRKNFTIFSKPMVSLRI